MTPVQHVVSSGVISGVFFYSFQHGAAAIACFLSGIFIDTDHVIDFLIQKRRIPHSYHDLIEFLGYQKDGRLYLFFHSYEFLTIFWLGIYAFNLNIIYMGIAIGLTAHLLLDQVFNPLRPLVYFFIYRLRHGFSKECVYREDKYRTLK